MAQGRFAIPNEYKDEDRWLKFFTKRQLVYVVLAALLDYIIYRIFNKWLLIWLVIDLIITLVAAVIALASIPKSRYLLGGGNSVETIITRIIIRRVTCVLYIKNYDEEEDR